MKRSLDRLDLKLLDVLQTDARISNQDLAARLALSPSACLARLRRLERDGVVRRYLADVALARVGSTLEVFAEVTLSNHTPADLRRFELVVTRVPEVVQAFQVSGAYDYLLHVVCRDMAHYRAVHDALASGRHGIEKVASHVVMADPKRFAGYALATLAAAGD